MTPLNPFPLTQGLFAQIASYIRFFLQQRNAAVLVCALLFLLIGPVPAVLIDVARLPARIYDHWLDKGLAERGRFNSG